MNNTTKAMNYAEILFQVCEEENKSKEILTELNNLVKLKARETNKVLQIPIIHKEKKNKLIDEFAAFDLDKLILNFMKILVSRNDFYIFREIIDEYKKIYERKEGITVVYAYTAKPISSENLNELASDIEKKLEKKVIISNQVEEQLIGGIRLEYNGKVIDNTLKKHLDSFENYLQRS